MTGPAEVTVLAPREWAPRVEQLAAVLGGSSVPDVVPDPSGRPADPSNLATVTCPSEWATDPAALRDALRYTDGVVTAPREGQASGAVAPIGDRLVYTVEEAATLLGISRSFAYEAVQRGDIPSMRIGKRILVPKAALDRWLSSVNPEDVEFERKRAGEGS